MADFEISGGCHCRAVRYGITTPAVDTHHCHCSVCRKAHGAIFVTLSVYPGNAFKYERGEGYLATYKTSENVHRHFCKTCGCQLTLDIIPKPDVIAIATGLDQGTHPGHPKESYRHLYADSKVDWYAVDEKIPQFAGGG
jgi:hypothetical protein